MDALCGEQETLRGSFIHFFDLLHSADDPETKFKVLFHPKKKNPESNKVQEFKLILQGLQERRKSASNFHKYLSSSSYLQQHKLFAEG